jgi:NAD(P)-dependent dehydrogenase (short-subunit alcohol dehydrogenase family)
MQRFVGKTAIVTGGNSGIGRDAALRFAAEGAQVAILARNAQSGCEVVREIEGNGGVAMFAPADVGDGAQVAAAMAAVVERFGGFEIAFNCSGITGIGKPLDMVGEDEFDAVVKTNLYGTFYCMKQQIAHFLSRRGGVIVNCASTSGLVGLPGLGAYCASKHGLLGLTKSVALDYAQRGIRVNAVCPGGVMTPMLSDYLADRPEERSAIDAAHPIGRMAEPGEVTGLVLWLCSDEASNVIGQSFSVDGGYTTR